MAKFLEVLSFYSLYEVQLFFVRKRCEGSYVMIQAPLLSRCDCCGLSISPQMGEDCPRCRYPIVAEKEAHFLEASLHELQRVAVYGGSTLTVEDLLYRYQARLNFLRKLLATNNIHAPMKSLATQTMIPATALVPPLAEKSEQPLAASSVSQSLTMQRPPLTFSMKSFVTDQAITIIGLLGAFLILMGALSAVVTTSNRLVSFLIVFGVHAFFGLAGVIAYRFANFRLISRIYVGIYVFMVPLVGFTAYSLIQGNYIQVSVPLLVAIASGYAAVVYFLLAIYQRFPLFGYLGGLALIVADLAIAENLQLGFSWWPSMLMFLALPAISTIIYTSPGRSQFFKGDSAVLRTPIRTYMLIIVGICISGIVLTTLLSLVFISRELRFAILSMTTLLFIWTSLTYWLTKRTTGLIVLAYEFLACVLACCYAFNVSIDGYVLALIGTALLYHGLQRFAPRLFAPFGKLDVRLDAIALVLVGLVPLIGALRVPFQLYAVAFHTVASLPASLLQQGSANGGIELLAIALGCLLTLSVVFHRVKLQRNGSGQTEAVSWSWLLLLTGFLLSWGYGLIVLALHIVPVWSFLGLSIVLAGVAIVVRVRFGTSWASPLEVLTLSEVVFTLTLSLGLDAAARSTLLLGIAVCSYCIILFQRRHQWLAFPLGFALAAVPDLLNLPLQETLLIAIVLPLVAVGIRRFMPATRLVTSTHAPEPVSVSSMWEWPLLSFGLLCGVIVSGHDVWYSHSAVSSAFHLPFPVALEMATLAIVWYGAAALGRVRWWLGMSIGFAVGAMLLPSNAFWVMVAVTAVVACLGVLVSQRVAKIWAMPLYLVALLGAVMTGITAYGGHLFAASWILPGFGLLAFVIGVVEDTELCLWLLPLFVTWSVIDAAALGDLYRPPISALAFVAVGVGISFLRHIPLSFGTVAVRQRFLRYALPFYATALAAAILTGVYGTLHGANTPFYGAIPTALLLYAFVAFAVVLFERKAAWLWLVAGFAIWGTLLLTQTSVVYVTSFGIGVGILGMVVGRIIRQPVSTGQFPLQINWGWPWYATSVVAAFVTALWLFLSVLPLPFVDYIAYSLLAFATVTCAIMLVERMPEFVVLPSVLVALAIWFWQPHLAIAPLMILYTLLCVLIFASQLIWNVLPPATHWLPTRLLPGLLGFGGQSLVVMTIILSGGLSQAAGFLAFVGAGTLGVLALLLFWYGVLQLDHAKQSTSIVQRSCNYGAGLLASLVVSWLLIAFKQSNTALLFLTPASYCILLAALLLRDEPLPYHHRMAQVAAIVGASLLLLPTLWLSFTNGDANVLYTLLLLGEALILLMLGTAIGVRVFVLTGAGLIIVGALHALFLPSLGIPTYLVLTILGIVALALATALSLFGRRLQTAWQHWN